MSAALPGHILLTTDAIGGVWRYTMTLATGLAAHGTRCTIALLGPSANPSQLEEIAKIPDAELIDTGLPLDWTIAVDTDLAAVIQSLRQIAARRHVDTVHLHAPALAAEPWPVPTIVVAHSCLATWWEAVRQGPMPDRFVQMTKRTTRGLRTADAVIAPSRTFAAALSRCYDLPHVANPVLNGLMPTPRRRRPRERHVLTAGRLWDEGKNPAVLDAAASMLDAAIWAAGPLSGPDGAVFAPRRMIPLGNLSEADLHQAMDSAAIFASAAFYEPFGLTALEAALGRTPLVLSDIPTHRELWDGAAIFVPPDEPGAWAATLAALLDNAAEREALGARAHARASGYTSTRMVDATVAIHQTVACRTPVMA